MDDMFEVTGVESMQWNRTAQEPVCGSGQDQTATQVLEPIDPQILQEVREAIAAETASLT